MISKFIVTNAFFLPVWTKMTSVRNSTFVEKVAKDRQTKRNERELIERKEKKRREKEKE